MIVSTEDFRIVLREGVEFRCFPASVVAYHPDSGDTLVLDALSGRILQAMAEAGGMLGSRELAGRLAGESMTEAEQLFTCLDELELRDLVRTIGPA